MFSIIDDCIVDHEARAESSMPSADRLSSEKPQNHITPNVAISDSGNATPAMMVARMVRRENQDDQDDQRDAEHQP
jgi:hypothetical protein